MNDEILTKITIITPSFNQGQFLEETIISVLNQRYANLEYIIMDGGSTDNSVEIIKKYANRLTYWQSKQDGGQAAAINEAIGRSSGGIIGWLNSDDVLVDGALEIVGKFFSSNPEALWAVGGGNFIDSKGSDVRTVYPNKLDFPSIMDWSGNSFSQPSTFWRKELWQSSGGLLKDYHYAFDYDLWLKFAKEASGYSIPHILSSYRVHESTKSSAHWAEQYVETLMIRSMHGGHKEVLKVLSQTVLRCKRYDRLMSIFGLALWKKVFCKLSYRRSM